jgi:glycosyltransferase involved in cell wall biosynthesis
VSVAPSISACVIARNEATRLAACLEALRWADEIVVVDDESTDATVDVARRFTDRVLVRAKADDFAGQRNAALAHARGDWAMFVDADERVSPGLAAAARAAVGDARFAGYAVRRQDVHFGHVFHHGESLRVPLLRLARRDAGRWVGRVHETWRVEGRVGALRHPLVHHSHEDVAHFVAKLDSYTTLGARRLVEEGRGRRLWELAAYPLASFLRNYVLRQGFRDGVPGFVLACLMASHAFVARAKVLEQRAGR